MLKPQKKMTKKEIKEDKFVQTALTAKAYVEENYRKVTMITAIIFGIIVLFMGWRYYNNQIEERSSAILGQAQLEYQNLNYTKSKEFLFRLLEEYSGTNAALQGQFLLANLYFQENNLTEAKANFKEFVDSYNKSNILISSGYAGYAACLEKEKNYEQAAEYYERAQKEAAQFIEAPNYLYLAGINYKNAGLFDKARQTFRKIMDEYPTSAHKEYAQAELIILAQK